MLIYKFSEVLYYFNKTGKHLNYNCKHSLNFAGHAHKGNATEVAKMCMTINLLQWRRQQHEMQLHSSSSNHNTLTTLRTSVKEH